MEQTIFKRRGRELAIAGAIVIYLLPLMGMDIKTYLTLTIAGIAMGMMLFLVASGLSLIFGLMMSLILLTGSALHGGPMWLLASSNILTNWWRRIRFFKIYWSFCLPL